MLEQHTGQSVRMGPQAKGVLYPLPVLRSILGCGLRWELSLILGNAPWCLAWHLYLKLKISLFLLPNAFPFMLSILSFILFFNLYFQLIAD